MPRVHMFGEKKLVEVIVHIILTNKFERYRRCVLMKFHLCVQGWKCRDYIIRTIEDPTSVVLSVVFRYNVRMVDGFSCIRAELAFWSSAPK